MLATDAVDPAIPAYINRLSDLFFTLARAEMDQAGVAEEKWQLFLYKRFKRAEDAPQPETPTA